MRFRRKQCGNCSHHILLTLVEHSGIFKCIMTSRDNTTDGHEICHTKDNFRFEEDVCRTLQVEVEIQSKSLLVEYPIRTLSPVTQRRG